MGAALSIINAVMALLPQFVALFEEVLGASHPAAAQLRSAVGDVQAAHKAATAALPN